MLHQTQSRGGHRIAKYLLVRGTGKEGDDFEEAQGRRLRIGCHYFWHVRYGLFFFFCLRGRGLGWVACYLPMSTRP